MASERYKRLVERHNQFDVWLQRADDPRHALAILERMCRILWELDKLTLPADVLAEIKDGELRRFPTCRRRPKERGRRCLETTVQGKVQSYMWSNIAASRASTLEDRNMALEMRNIVESKMTPDEIAKAQRLAREWKPKTAP